MDDEEQIRALLATYEQALNAGDAQLAASVYTSDGVFMPTTLPTAAGTELEKAYAKIFKMISLDVTFTIDELVVMSAATAYALTRSQGTQTVLDSAEVSVESNREVFLFARTDDGWKVSRYMFNKPE